MRRRRARGRGGARPPRGRARHGAAHRHPREHRDAAGLRLAAEIAAADPRVAGLQIGFADLFEPLGIDRRDAAAVQQVQLAVRLAAGEAGVLAYDAAFADVNDAEGFRREAEVARRLGFIGKSCIHPSQVPIANAVFRPSEAEIAQALRVVAARGRRARRASAPSWSTAG